jgi:hypothetical protein
MARYIVTWEMVYEDCDSHLEAVCQAYGNLAEIASNPTIGANFVTVRDLDNPQAFTAIEIGEALALHNPDALAPFSDSKFTRKCVECEKFISADEFYYGHDCEV